MQLQVKFFASLRDDLGCEVYGANLQEHSSFNDLMEHLQSKFGAAAAVLQDQGVRVAVNLDLVAPAELSAKVLAAGDEVAFLPPVTGG